jgi:hypothetical protein
MHFTILACILFFGMFFTLKNTNSACTMQNAFQACKILFQAVKMYTGLQNLAKSFVGIAKSF